MYVIDYEGWEEHHDVMELGVLRPLNPHTGFEDTDVKPISKKEIELSGDRAYEWIRTNLDQLRLIKDRTGLYYNCHCFVLCLALFQHAQKMQIDLKISHNIKAKKWFDRSLVRVFCLIGLIHLGYRPDRQKVIMIGTRSQIWQANKLYHYLHEIQHKYKAMQEDATEREKQLNNQYSRLKNCCSCKFKFDPELIGFVIGRSGRNVKAAKSEGVEHVNVDPDKCECLILAQTNEALQSARDILEIVKDVVSIPRESLPGMIGPSGTNVKNLERTSQVALISTMNHYQTYILKNPDYDGYQDSQQAEVEMVIIGPKLNVSIAKELILDNVELLEQVRNHNVREREVHRELRDRDYSYEYPYSQPYNMRDDGAYNGDMNGNNGGGGGGRYQGKSKRRRDRQRGNNNNNNNRDRDNRGAGGDEAVTTRGGGQGDYGDQHEHQNGNAPPQGGGRGGGRGGGQSGQGGPPPQSSKGSKAKKYRKKTDSTSKST